jgi:hypothetical protein
MSKGASPTAALTLQNTEGGVRTHADMCLLELESNPLDHLTPREKSRVRHRIMDVIGFSFPGSDWSRAIRPEVAS